MGAARVTLAAPRDERELEDRLSDPPSFLTRTLVQVPGDIIILGAGGKMGPSLARMAKRADPARRVIAVSRWSNASAEEFLRSHGVECLSVNLLHAASVSELPHAPNVVFMAGQKFGTSGNPSATWAMNAAVPAFCAERYSRSRIAVFSTGNVYPLTAITRGGAREDDELAPVGEYAYSCLARERIFSATCARHGTPTSIIRLNYAHDLRYGVLTDIAARILRREPIDVRMGFVNVIWQRDANAIALASLAHASAPDPFILNVAGPQTLRVRNLARSLGMRLGIDPAFVGSEGEDALLSNSDRMHTAFSAPLLPLDTLIDWVAEWVQGGGRLLNKPTSFERRDGRF